MLSVHPFPYSKEKEYPVLVESLFITFQDRHVIHNTGVAQCSSLSLWISSRIVCNLVVSTMIAASLSCCCCWVDTYFCIIIGSWVKLDLYMIVAAHLEHVTRSMIQHTCYHYYLYWLEICSAICIIHFSVTYNRLYPVCCTPLDVASILTIPWTANHHYNTLIAISLSKFYRFSYKRWTHVWETGFEFSVFPVHNTCPKSANQTNIKLDVVFLC